MLKLLQKIIQEVSAAPTTEAALASVVKQLNDALQSDACSIFLCDDHHAVYILMATCGLNPELIGKARLKFGEGLVGLIGQREAPMNLEDAQLHPNFLRYKNLGEEDFHGFLGVPIVERGEVLGVLLVQQKEARHFGEDEEAFCVTLAIQLATGIAHARARGAMALLTQKHSKKKSTILYGLSGASGIGIGTAVVTFPPADIDAVPDQQTENSGEEITHFEKALVAAKKEIQQLQSRAKTNLSVAESAIFDAYLRILDSRTLINEAIEYIKSGLWAQSALKRVIKKHVAHFEALDDVYLRERAADFRDLGRRILRHLQASEAQQLEFPKKAILVSDEVTASALLEIPREQLVAVISGSGSSNSHVAILARALGIPTVMGVSGMSLSELDGKECIVDGYNGHVYLLPSQNLKKEFRALIQEESELDAELETLRDLPAITEDKRRFSLYVNTGLAVEGGMSLSVGAEGVGLYRTEMPFMVRDRFPSEEEQRIMYRQLLTTFMPRPVTMRTLDIGGDKQLPYFHIEEENPFLGWRGTRVMLDHPEIFLQQIRAMLQASSGLNNLSILLPMITSVSEVESSLRLIHQAFDELKAEGLEIKMPEIGLMIEVPAAVYQAYELAKRVDFISVGSNDLIQYLLAVDRNNPRVANRYNGLHPAVVRALYQVVKAAHRARKPVEICGELAGDPLAAILLLGMGFDVLSMNARSLPRIKWLIRQFSYEAAQELVEKALEMDDPRDIRLLLEQALLDAGLIGLVRAGR